MLYFNVYVSRVTCQNHNEGFVAKHSKLKLNKGKLKKEYTYFEY